MNARLAILATVLAVFPAQGLGQTRHSLVRFQSAGELSAYLADPHPAPSSSLTSIRDPSSLFWVQTSQGGDDGGDVVKVHGDHLVVLRGGRLFTVSTTGKRLKPISDVDAFDGDIEADRTRYDEVLVSGGSVVAIGYGGRRGWMELRLFRIDAGGRLSHRATCHLRSNNLSAYTWASRLKGTRLVLYVPLRVGHRHDPSAWLPAMRRWHPGGPDAGFRPIVSPTRIYRPGGQPDVDDRTVLHTLVTCELARPELACSATGVLGPAGQELHVSGTATYVWASNVVRATRPHAAARLYRLPLDGTSPSALGVRGRPINHLSFQEGRDGSLNVLTTSDPAGTRAWPTGEVRLLRVPLARFADGTTSASAGDYRVLPGGGGEGVFENRFVGPYLLYGTDDEVRSPRGELWIARVRDALDGRRGEHLRALARD